ncbi:MAG: squalene/phytoene synthase family protein, partial [Dongiaceae bacterium]
MRLLPAHKRQAMFAVYAFCRVVDDIADGDLPSAAKLVQLQGWRDEIDRLFAGRPQHPITVALAEPVRRFGLARDDFIAVIDGMAMDARAPLVAPPLAELELYCARVAGAVGLLSVRIFGAPPETGPALARALGEAVQLTNVLRDIEEDAALGRLYLPRELLERHGVPISAPMAMLKNA